MSEGGNRSVVIHQVSTRHSQIPFAKPKGLVQCILFHPVRPFLFVAVSYFLALITCLFFFIRFIILLIFQFQTQKNVRIYDLVKQELFKKLQTYAQWISSMAIHSGIYLFIFTCFEYVYFV